MKGEPNHDGQTAYWDPITGRIEQQQLHYAYPPVRGLVSSTIYDEEEVTCRGLQGSHTINHARRSNQVNGWRVTTANLTDFSFLRRVGSGQGLSLQENWFSLQPPTTSMRAGNPTMGGAVSLPYSSVGAFGNNSLHYFSPSRHYRNGSTGNSAFAEAACIPLEFDTNQTENWGGISHAADNGGGRNTCLLWHRMRMFQRLDVNWRRENVHRVVGWSYYPNAIDSDDGTARCAMDTGLFLQDFFGGVGVGEAYWYSPYTNTTTTFENIFGTGVTFAGDLGSTWYHSYVTQPLGTMVVTGNQNAATFFPVQSPNRKTIEFGILLRTIDPQLTGEDFVIGVYVCMSSTIGLPMSDEFITNIQLINFPGAGGGGRDVSAGPAFLFGSLHSNRPAGWIGHQVFICTGNSVGNVAALMQQLFAEGAAREPTPFGVLPQHLLAEAPARAPAGVI